MSRPILKLWLMLAVAFVWINGAIEDNWKGVVVGGVVLVLVFLVHFVVLERRRRRDEQRYTESD